MSILWILLMKFLIIPFILIIIPIILLCWLVISYDEPSIKDPDRGKEGGDEGIE